MTHTYSNIKTDGLRCSMFYNKGQMKLQCLTNLRNGLIPLLMFVTVSPLPVSCNINTSIDIHTSNLPTMYIAPFIELSQLHITALYSSSLYLPNEIL